MKPETAFLLIVLSILLRNLEDETYLLIINFPAQENLFFWAGR